MTRLLIIATSLGFAVSGAAACDFLHTASKVDETKVASISSNPTQNMSTPTTAPTQTPVIVKKKTETATTAQTE